MAIIFNIGKSSTHTHVHGKLLTVRLRDGMFSDLPPAPSNSRWQGGEIPKHRVDERVVWSGGVGISVRSPRGSGNALEAAQSCPRQCDGLRRVLLFINQQTLKDKKHIEHLLLGGYLRVDEIPMNVIVICLSLLLLLLLLWLWLWLWLLLFVVCCLLFVVCCLFVCLCCCCCCCCWLLVVVVVVVVVVDCCCC